MFPFLAMLAVRKLENPIQDLLLLDTHVSALGKCGVLLKSNQRVPSFLKGRM